MIDKSRGPERGAMPVSYIGEGHASVMTLVSDDIKPMTYEAASGGTARILEAWDYTNILAIGCDLAVIDPTLLDEEEWNTLCEVYGSYVDVEFKMLLVKPSPYKSTMPARNVTHAPAELTVECLHQQMSRAARVPKSKAIWQKRERQITRMMYMLQCLDTSELRLRDVAERFEVSVRTIQRDLDVLLAADFTIEDGDKPGTYRFPKGYKAYQAYHARSD